MIHCLCFLKSFHGPSKSFKAVGIKSQFNFRVQDLKGGSNISWFPKKGHQILKGGVQWSDRGGGVQYISLPRTTNLAYLDAKE